MAWMKTIAEHVQMYQKLEAVTAAAPRMFTVPTHDTTRTARMAHAHARSYFEFPLVWQLVLPGVLRRPTPRSTSRSCSSRTATSCATASSRKRLSSVARALFPPNQAR